MKKAWQYTWSFVPVVVLILLLTLPCVSVCASNGSNGAQTSTTTVSPAPDDNGSGTKATTAAKSKAKPVAKTRDKSVLDAEVLDSPLSYFREAFTPEEDNTSSPALINTVKALVATLLSTVL